MPDADVVEYIFPDGRTAYLRHGWHKGAAQVWRGDLNGGLVQLIFDPTLPRREPSKGAWHNVKRKKHLPWQERQTPHRPGTLEYRLYLDKQFRRTKYPITAPQRKIIEQLKEGREWGWYDKPYKRGRRSGTSRTLVWVYDRSPVLPLSSAQSLWNRGIVPYPYDIVDCPDCGGDGVAVCRNPDHGFIAAMPGEIGRLGCPVCGHSDTGKIEGEPCDTCGGKGVTTAEAAQGFRDAYKID